MHDRRDGIEEGKLSLAGQSLDGGRERWGGERTGGDDDIGPVPRGQPGDLPPLDADERVLLETARDGGAEAIPIHRHGATGGPPAALPPPPHHPPPPT